MFRSLKMNLRAIIFIVLLAPILAFSQEAKDTIEQKGIDEEIFIDPEIPAEFPDSMVDFMKFVTKHFTIPEDCIDQSKFYFRFLVSKEGRVTDVSLLQSTCQLPEKVRKDMLAKMPIWKPAENKGEKVDSYVTMPMTICFK